MTAVDPSQLELSQRRQISAITLMTVTTFSDRQAQTVDTVHYFADRGVRFDDGGGAHDYLPFIVAVGDLKHEMEHLSGGDSGPLIFTRDMNVTMRNGELDGTSTTLFMALNAENIVNARVRVFELLLPSLDEWHPSHDTLASLAGKQTPFYSGIVEQLTNITDETFTMRLVAELPELDYEIVNTLTADEVITGVVANDVYGLVGFIPCHGFDVGDAELLQVFIDNSETTISIARIENFPDSGSVMIGRELITYTGRDVSNHLLTGCSRGQGGTFAVGHSAAELVVSMLTTGAKYLVARHAMESISNVFVRSPLDGKLLLAEGNYTAYTSTSVGIPNGMTGPVAYIHFSQSNIRALIEKFYGQAQYEGTPPVSDADEATANNGYITEGDSTYTFPTDVPSGNFGTDDAQGADLTLSAGVYEFWQRAGTFPDCVAFQWTGLGALPGVDTYITQWRLRLDVDEVHVADNNADIELRGYGVDISGLGGSADTDYIFNTDWSKGEYGLITLYTEWYTAPASTFLTAFNATSAGSTWVGPNIVLYIRAHGYRVGNYLRMPDDAITLEYQYTTPGTEDSRIVDANSATRFQGGQGLEVYARGGGYTVPVDGVGYSVPDGVLMQSSSDIARHLIERAGFTDANIDNTTWGQDLVEFGSPYAVEHMETIDLVTEAAPGNGPTGYALSGTSTYDTVSTESLGEVTLTWTNGSTEGAVYTFASTLTNSQFIRRWSFQIVGDFTGGAGAFDYARLAYQLRNVPAGAGGFSSFSQTETEGASNRDSVNIPGTESSGTVLDYTITAGPFSPTVPTMVSEFSTINRTTWDGVHVAMQIGQDPGCVAIIKEVRFVFEVGQRGFVQSDMGFRLDSVLGRLGFESRSQIVNVEGDDGVLFRWLMAQKTAPATYDWTVNGDPITEWARSEEDTRRLQDIYSRYRLFDIPDRTMLSSGASQEEMYRHVFQVDPNVSDLSAFTTTQMAAVEAKTGNRENRGMFFVSTIVAGTEEMGEYFIAESIRYPSATVQLTGVPWTQAYDRAIGDIFMLQLSYWDAPKKMRIIGLEKHWQIGSVNVACVEVT